MSAMWEPFETALTMAGADKEPCGRCDGDGWVEIFDPEHYGAVVGAVVCPACNGAGRIP